MWGAFGYPPGHSFSCRVLSVDPVCLLHNTAYNFLTASDSRHTVEQMKNNDSIMEHSDPVAGNSTSMSRGSPSIPPPKGPTITLTEVPTPQPERCNTAYCAILVRLHTDSEMRFVKSSCGHVFHRGCIVQFLKANGSCAECQVLKADGMNESLELRAGPIASHDDDLKDELNEAKKEQDEAVAAVVKPEERKASPQDEKFELTHEEWEKQCKQCKQRLAAKLQRMGPIPVGAASKIWGLNVSQQERKTPVAQQATAEELKQHKLFTTKSVPSQVSGVKLENVEQDFLSAAMASVELKEQQVAQKAERGSLTHRRQVYQFKRRLATNADYKQTVYTGTEIFPPHLATAKLTFAGFKCATRLDEFQRKRPEVDPSLRQTEMIKRLKGIEVDLTQGDREALSKLGRNRNWGKEYEG